MPLASASASSSTAAATAGPGASSDAAGSAPPSVPPTPAGGVEAAKKECWTCGGDHEDLDCPHRVFVERSASSCGGSLVREGSADSAKSGGSHKSRSSASPPRGLVRDASVVPGRPPPSGSSRRRGRGAAAGAAPPSSTSNSNSASNSASATPVGSASSLAKTLFAGVLRRGGSSAGGSATSAGGSSRSSVASNNNSSAPSSAPSSAASSPGRGLLRSAGSQRSGAGAGAGNGAQTPESAAGSLHSWGSARLKRHPSAHLLSRASSLRLNSPSKAGGSGSASPPQAEPEQQPQHDSGGSGVSGVSGASSDAAASEEQDTVPGLRSGGPSRAPPVFSTAGSSYFSPQRPLHSASPAMGGPPTSAVSLGSLRSTASHVIREEGDRDGDGPLPLPYSLSALGVEGTRAPSSLRGPLPPVPSSLRGAFSVDTPWLSLLTLRYVVAQVWALHCVKISCTLTMVGVVAEAARYWKVSLPLLLLLGTIVYLRASALGALAAALDAEAAGRVISPLQSRTMQLMRYALRDQSRTKLLVMALQVLPAALELYGLVVLFVRIHRLPPPANTLPVIVAVYLGCALFLCNTLLALHQTAAEHPLLRFRFLKLGLQFLVLTFLLGAAEYDSFVRLLPPALIACGGVLFLTLSPADIETAVRSGLTLMLQDVCLYTRRRITEDELLQVALARWLLEYWTQPTDFSWEDFLPMMQHVLLTLRDEMVDTVHPAIHKLQCRLEDMSIDAAAVPMVKAARARLQKIAPSKPFTAYLIYYRSTRHIAAFLLSMLFSWLLPRLGLLPQYPHPAATSGLIIPWALLPLVLQDLLVLNHYLPQLLLLAQADYTDADGASLLLQGTSLATVWENLRYAVRALEGGLHVVRVYQPSDKALGFINAMKLAYARAREQAAAQGGAAAAALLGADGWMFAGGWAAMELLRIKASPHGSRIAGAAGDASVIYRSLMAVYGDWLVHAPGIFNTWLHSRMFTTTRADIRALPPHRVPSARSAGSGAGSGFHPPSRGNSSQKAALAAQGASGSTLHAPSSLSSAGSYLGGSLGGVGTSGGSFSYLDSEDGALLARDGSGRGIPIPVLITPGTSYAVAPSSGQGADGYYSSGGHGHSAESILGAAAAALSHHNTDDSLVATMPAGTGGLRTGTTVLCDDRNGTGGAPYVVLESPVEMEPARLRDLKDKSYWGQTVVLKRWTSSWFRPGPGGGPVHMGEAGDDAHLFESPLDGPAASTSAESLSSSGGTGSGSGDDLGNGLVNPAAVNEDSLSPTLAQLQAAAAAATAQARDDGRGHGGASPPPMPPRPHDTLEIATVKGLFSEGGPSEVFVLPAEEEEEEEEEDGPRGGRNRVSTVEEEALRRSLLSTPPRPARKTASWLPGAGGDGSGNGGGGDTPSRLSSSLRRLAGSLLGGGKQLGAAEQGEGPSGMSSSLRQRRPPRGLSPARVASL